MHDSFQKGYTYELTEPIGRNFHPDFKPELTPTQMLALGVFGGKYMTDCRKEFPKSWFVRAKLSPKHHDDKLNFFIRMPANPLKCGRKKAGLMKIMTHAVGFNGTVAIIWVDVCQLKTSDR